MNRTKNIIALGFLALLGLASIAPKLVAQSTITIDDNDHLVAWPEDFIAANCDTPYVNATGTETIAGAKTFSDSTVFSKLSNSGAPATTGDLNTGQAGVYVYRNGDASRYIAFDTLGGANDLRSLGSNLVVNHSSGTDVEFFGGTPRVIYVNGAISLGGGPHETPASTRSLLIRGGASQSGSLLILQNSSSTPVADIDDAGNATFSGAVHGAAFVGDDLNSNSNTGTIHSANDGSFDYWGMSFDGNGTFPLKVTAEGRTTVQALDANVIGASDVVISTSLSVGGLSLADNISSAIGGGTLTFQGPGVFAQAPDSADATGLLVNGDDGNIWRIRVVGGVVTPTLVGP